jgi:Domain of unknown function (DUF4440)
MIRRTALLLVAATFFASATFALPEHPASAAMAIKQLENEWLHVKDVATLNRILASDFVHVLPDGFVTKEQELAYRRAHGFGDSAPVKRFAELKVRVYSETAIANGIVIDTDHRGAVLRKTLFTDVFVERNGRWQAVNAQELPVKP